MAIERVGGVPSVSPAQGQEGSKASFAETFKGAGQGAGARTGPVRASESPAAHRGTEAGRSQAARPVGSPTSQAKAVNAAATRERAAVRVAEQVQAAQQRLDHVLKLAESGKTFTPAELLALQAQVYRASQVLDLAGKVVEKATSGVKQVLQTQV